MEENRPASRFLDPMFCLFGSAGISAFYALFFLDLFPLVEFRDWIASPLTTNDFLAALKRVILRDNVYDRELSMCFSRFAGLAGGMDIRALNLIMLAPVAGACVFLYVLCRQLRLSPFFSLVTLLLWGFSLPVIDAVSWQATSHDRLSLFFALPALNLAVFFAGRRASLGNIVGANLLILVCVVGAYNSKLSSLFLVPCIVLFMLMCIEGGIRQRLSKLLFLVLPMAYGAFHNLRYFTLLKASEDSSEHVMGRTLSDWNFIPSLNYAIGYSSHKKGAIILGFAAFLLILFIGGLIMRKRKGEASVLSPRACCIVWLFITFCMATAITFFTKYFCAYYQFTPRIFLMLLLMQVITFFFEPLGRGILSKVSSRVIPIALLVASLILFFDRALPDYTVRLELSDNFVASFPTIREHVDPAEGPIRLTASAPTWRVYWFYSGSRRALLRFIFGDEEVAHLPWNELMEGTADVAEADWAPRPDESGYRICFDANFKLAAIYHNDKKIL